MTRLAVLADIHGNLPALEAVLQDLAQFHVDHVIAAGDVISFGPFPAQVLEHITQRGWAVIRGNAEFYLLDYGTPRAPAEWSDQARFPLPGWLHRQLNGRWHNAIAAWPDALSLRFPDAPPVRVVHGSPRSATELMYPTSSDEELEAMLAEVQETTLIAGHTHLPMERQVGRWHVLNPGSVGGPLDGEISASYMLLEGSSADWQATFRRVPFDLDPILREFERQEFVERCGVIGRLAVEDFKTARPIFLAFLRWHQACCPDTPLTDELLDKFAQVNLSDYLPAAYHINLST